jgi:lipopolysaccharide transport system ATP-binding protein
MAEPIIRVTGLSKSYRLAHQARHDTLRDSLAHGARGLVRRWLRGGATETAEEFWALRDVSFDVARGEVVGVIGRNGAGKSTLLKILSRITEPTTGRVELRGRVASLLEVGTGFHPELTGRENIFLNGAILGMSRAEIARKFDEIVAFAEVERFLDTPVKHYSSGMYVRLAFAVAAHLEPEILIVDEVLAVGDAQFQRKCLGKMQEVARGEGRTVLFVSHNMSAVRNLCTRCLYLEAGLLHLAADTETALAVYLQRASTADSASPSQRRSGDGRIRLTGFRVEDARGETVSVLASGTPCSLVFSYENHGAPAGQAVDVGFGVHAPTGERLLVVYASQMNQTYATVHAKGEFRCRLESLPLATGRYFVYPRVEINGREADFPQDGLGVIDVDECDFYGTGQVMGPRGHAPFLLRAQWSETEARA